MKTNFTRTIELLLACILLCACTRNVEAPQTTATTSNTENSVAAFLKNAELQAETDQQRSEIRRALRDMLEKSPAELRQDRFADYTGQADQWTIIELLPHYFVPNPPMAFDETSFYRDVAAPLAREAIQRKLDELDHSPQ